MGGPQLSRGKPRKETPAGIASPADQSPARQIIDILFKAVKDFQQGYKPEGEITLVVIKVARSGHINNRNDL